MTRPVPWIHWLALVALALAVALAGCADQQRALLRDLEVDSAGSDLPAIPLGAILW